MNKHNTYITLFYCIALIIPQLLLAFIFNEVITDDIAPKWQLLKTIWGTLLAFVIILVSLDFKKKIANWVLPLFVIITYLTGLFVFVNMDLINTLPSIITDRVDYTIIPLYLTIPGLLYALIDLILKKFPPRATYKSNLANLAYSIITPLTTYFIVVVIIPFLKKIFTNDLSYFSVDFIQMIVISIGVTVFLFFGIRYIIGYFKRKEIKANNPFVILIFGLILPFVGLAFNANLEAFGDFDFPIIYGVVFLNTIGLYASTSNIVKIKLLGFIICCFGAPYVLYFFIVFIPYLPIALITLIVLGIGLLLLTPIILFIIQAKSLIISFNELKLNYSPKLLITFGLIATLAIPSIIIYTCENHKRTLQDIVNKTYHYDSDNLIYTDFNISKVDFILTQMNIRNRHNSFLSKAQRMPLISIYYDWHVFNNLKLSNSRVKDIQKLFLGEEKPERPWQRRVAPIKLKDRINYHYTTKHIENGDYYQTQINLEITNLENENLREFNTEFNLPEDVFITQYYLDIEDRREYGILAEKNAANWIYNQITNQQKDPGILQYLSDKKLSLKIFPFKENETRISGFTIYHKESVHFKINDTDINIPIQSKNNTIIEFTKNSYYIPPNAKQLLPKSTIKTQYYFLIDNTELGEEYRNHFKQDQNTLKNSKIPYDVLYVDADVSWNDKPKTKASGFNYIKALNQIQQLHKNNKQIPMIIVYANTKNRYYADKNELHFKESFPLNNLIESENWNKKPIEDFDLLTFSRNGHTTHLRNDKEPEIISFDSIENTTFNPKTNSFAQGLHLRLFEKLSATNPKNKRKYWLKSLQQSFKQNILSHNTTYIALETEDQKQRLLKKQEDIINNKFNNNPSEEIRMSEPYFWLLLLVLIFIFFKPKALLLILKKQYT